MKSINNKSSREEVLAAVKQDGRALQHASEELTNDPEIIAAANSSSLPWPAWSRALRRYGPFNSAIALY